MDPGTARDPPEGYPGAIGPRQRAGARTAARDGVRIALEQIAGSGHGPEHARFGA